MPAGRTEGGRPYRDHVNGSRIPEQPAARGEPTWSYLRFALRDQSRPGADRLDDLPLDVRLPSANAVAVRGRPLVVNREPMQYRRMQIVGRHRLSDRNAADGVDDAEAEALGSVGKVVLP